MVLKNCLYKLNFFYCILFEEVGFGMATAYHVYGHDYKRQWGGTLSLLTCDKFKVWLVGSGGRGEGSVE